MTLPLFGYGARGIPQFFDRLFGSDPDWWARKLQRIAPTPDNAGLALALAAWRADRDGHPMDDDTFLGLAHQCGLTRSSRGLKIPPGLRERLGLPTRINRPVQLLEAAVREGLADHDVNLRDIADEVGVALSTLQEWRRVVPEYLTIRKQAEVTDFDGEPVMVFAGRLRIWKPESPSDRANTGNPPRRIPVGTSPSQTGGNVQFTQHAATPLP